jgi:hypothetical protein
MLQFMYYHGICLEELRETWEHQCLSWDMNTSILQVRLIISAQTCFVFRYHHLYMTYFHTRRTSDKVVSAL